MPSHRSGLFPRPSLPLTLFWALLACVWLAGGASRPDVLGQVVVRGTAWTLLVVLALFGPRPSFVGSRPVLVFLFAALALALLQLVPLPADVWQNLPGRRPLAGAILASGQSLSWGQWSMVPQATLNAAGSLVVPFATLLLLLGIQESERRLVITTLLTFIGASMIIGLLQFSTGAFNNVFVNDTRGVISGMFANRNHFALLLAIGCLLAPVWASESRDVLSWRAAPAAGLALLFLLTLLATGSRAGLVLGILGILLGLLISGRTIRRALKRYPSWVFPALMTGVVGIGAIGVLASVVAGRAESINRFFAMDQGQDMRMRGLPIVWQMTRDYFPVGTGLGTFDPVFRMYEPMALLKPTYFNHAHNDFLEIVLTGGLPGLLLLGVAIGWWVWASVGAWKARSAGSVLPISGSAILFLILVASVFDYPARTPTIMAFIVIAATWLSAHGRAGSSALPQERASL